VADGTLTALALEASEDLPIFRKSEQQETLVPVPPSETSIVLALRKALTCTRNAGAESSAS
jgi:hypothetical protein